VGFDRVFAAKPATVTIGLLEGRTQVGTVAKFSPATADLAVTLSTAPKLPSGATPRTTLAAERVAYVAFHREDLADAPSTATPELKIHVAGGAQFLVDVVRSEGTIAVGFYARARDPNTPFGEIFFYNHGINAKEMNQPFGAMLVRDGRLNEHDVRRGLAAQHDSRVPIGQILVEHKKVNAAAIEEAAALQTRKRLRIGEILIEAGLAQTEDIEFALAEQKRRGGKRLGQILVELNLIPEEDMSRTLARKFHLPFVDLDATDINLEALSELPKDVIEKHKVLPVEADLRSLTIALSDPLAVDTIDALRFHTKKQIHEVVSTPTQLEKYIPKYLDMVESAKVANEMNEIIKGLAIEDPNVTADVEPASEQGSVNESDSAVIKLANQIIIDAYRRGASDIHIEPNGLDASMRIRFRVDGDCAAYQEIPSRYRQPLVSRLKIMANLDISERRKPQDGKIRFRVGTKQIELRVATIPTVNNNEDVVLRILAASKPLPLDQMGFASRNLSRLRDVIAKPYGLVLCVGPTGSGKTTTLHSTLGAINTVDMKIWTAEDPVEITQAGLRQVQVNTKIGFTFAAAMRAFLRADPDVIMVGEMRDLETASTAVEASLTGHLVFSTLHTNSAPETVTRLIDMGLEPFSFADALLGVLAQRLARTLCKQCREAYSPGADEVAELRAAYGREAFDKLGLATGAGLKLFRAKGCNACANSGYKGRVGVHELLVTDDEIKRVIQQKAPVDTVRTMAIAAGMSTLLQDGVEKVLAGITDLKQVLAVCSR
jgi:type II secretory ATPase GspE/PulE/Tfp pilus assembly ATPase PilB-like protein